MASCRCGANAGVDAEGERSSVIATGVDVEAHPADEDGFFRP